VSHEVKHNIQQKLLLAHVISDIYEEVWLPRISPSHYRMLLYQRAHNESRILLINRTDVIIRVYLQVFKVQ
jgi:hypothetical protein